MSTDGTHPLSEAALLSFRPGAPDLDEVRAAHAAAPDDLVLRARYLGRLARDFTPAASASNDLVEEVLWWIRERPLDLEHVAPALYSMSHVRFETYVRLREALQAALDRHGSDAGLLRTAAGCMQHQEPDTARRLLERAHALAPQDVSAAWMLGGHHMRDALAARLRGKQDAERAAAGEAVRWFEAALERARDIESRRMCLVGGAPAAFVAGDLDLAERRARELVTIATAHTDASGRAQPVDGHALHDGHVVLGRVALARGDRAAACEHLARAATTEGSPVLNSFGPELALADDLLQAGERATVLDYLAAVARFWRMDQGRVERWRTRIEAGETPRLARHGRD